MTDLNMLLSCFREKMSGLQPCCHPRSRHLISSPGGEFIGNLIGTKTEPTKKPIGSSPLRAKERYFKPSHSLLVELYFLLGVLTMQRVLVALPYPLPTPKYHDKIEVCVNYIQEILDFFPFY